LNQNCNLINPALYRGPHATARDRTGPPKAVFYVNRDRKQTGRHPIAVR